MKSYKSRKIDGGSQNGTEVVVRAGKGEEMQLKSTKRLSEAGSPNMTYCGNRYTYLLVPISCKVSHSNLLAFVNILSIQYVNDLSWQG